MVSVRLGLISAGSFLVRVWGWYRSVCGCADFLVFLVDFLVEIANPLCVSSWSFFSSLMNIFWFLWGCGLGLGGWWGCSLGWILALLFPGILVSGSLFLFGVLGLISTAVFGIFGLQMLLSWLIRLAGVLVGVLKPTSITFGWCWAGRRVGRPACCPLAGRGLACSWVSVGRVGEVGGLVGLVGGMLLAGRVCNVGWPLCLVCWLLLVRQAGRHSVLSVGRVGEVGGLVGLVGGLLLAGRVCNVGRPLGLVCWVLLVRQAGWHIVLSYRSCLGILFGSAWRTLCRWGRACRACWPCWATSLWLSLGRGGCSRSSC